MNEPITEDEALQRFPELSALVTLRMAGWTFRISNDAEGEPECLMASRSVQQYTDALFLFDRRNVNAARVLDESYGGGCVWTKQGADLQEVVQELLGLPEPGESGAPTLVVGSSLFWTPR